MNHELSDKIVYRPIGVVHSRHTAPGETPIQPVFAHGCRGEAWILPEYEEGLRDLEGFSHIHVIYQLHHAPEVHLTVKPFLDDAPHGVFATRSPSRPNPIGLSLVRLISRQANVLYLDDVDMLDGTPILDIKPYISRFDHRAEARCGWQEQVDERTASRLGRRGGPSP